MWMTLLSLKLFLRIVKEQGKPSKKQGLLQEKFLGKRIPSSSQSMGFSKKKRTCPHEQWSGFRKCRWNIRPKIRLLKLLLPQSFPRGNTKIQKSCFKKSALARIFYYKEKE